MNDEPTDIVRATVAVVGAGWTGYTLGEQETSATGQCRIDDVTGMTP